MVGTRKRKKSNPDPDVASSTSKSPPISLSNIIHIAVAVAPPQKNQVLSLSTTFDDPFQISTNTSSASSQLVEVALNYHGRYPLNKDEQKVWNEFTVNDKTKANSSLRHPIQNLVTVEDDMVVDLLGKFAVNTFNKSCQMGTTHGSKPPPESEVEYETVEVAIVGDLFLFWYSIDVENEYLSLDGDDVNDNYDKESIISLNAGMFETPSCDAIMTPSIEKPKDSLIMKDEDIDTIPEKESDEEIESGVANLFHIPSESEVTSDNENIECTNSLTNSSPKIDSLLEVFAGELALIDPIPPGIDNSDFDPEEELRLIEKLLYDNSSPRPPKESNSEISDAIIEYYSTSPILVEDSDSLMEEINLFLDPDDSIPPGIESDDYDSEVDVLFLEELLNDDYISPPAYKSFHVDLYNVPSPRRPPKKPPDNDIHTYKDFKNGYYDSEGDIIYLEYLLIKDTIPNLSPEVFFDHEPQCFKDEPEPDTLKSMVKVFDPGI
ncbi:hypothetical protein Tco_0091370 [Tanacetum coccineum]